MAAQTGPPRATELTIARALAQIYAGGSAEDNDFSLGIPKSHSGLVVADQLGIDAKTRASHAKWSTENSPWSGGSRTLGDKIEIQPPNGWYYRFPDAVPINAQSERLNEYGPDDYLPYGDSQFNPYKRLENPQMYRDRSLPFSRFGL
jgi:hypothetical protein